MTSTLSTSNDFQRLSASTKMLSKSFILSTISLSFLLIIPATHAQYHSSQSYSSSTFYGYNPSSASYGSYYGGGQLSSQPNTAVNGMFGNSIEVGNSLASISLLCSNCGRG
ncbi:hypothetical protein M3Y98_01010000 [Aphelenchoides besseyi]|nr:hypothetical protein M3Y98_01010000 [Aphelenchoides besseyi]KAI6210174.1 hypothetical protein M3Y96_00299700 [Aphelenchoides besseyi]